MEKLSKHKNMSIWLSLIYIALGLIFILWPSSAEVSICRIAGAGLLIFCAVRIIQHISSQAKGSFNITFDFALAAIGALLGLFMIILPHTVVNALSIIMGVLVLYDSIMRLSTAFSLKKAASKAWKLSMILALVTMAFGIVLLFDPFKGSSVFIVIVGIIFFAAGVTSIVDYISIKKIMK